MQGNFYAEVANQLGVRTTTINGAQYTIQLLPALAALELAKELACLLSPSFGVIFDKVRSEVDPLGEHIGFADVAFVLVKQLREFDLTKISKTLLSSVSCNGKAVDIDKHFQGKLKDLLHLVEFAIKENGILDFFIDYLREKGFEIPSLSQLTEIVKAFQSAPQESTVDEQSNLSEIPQASTE